ALCGAAASRLDAQIDIVLDIAPRLDGRVALAVAHDIKIVEAGGAAKLVEERISRSAGQLGRRGRKARKLHGRKFVDAAIEDEPGEHFVLRQFGLRGKCDL